MKRAVCTIAIAVAIAVAIAAPPARATDEPKFELRAGESVKTLLADAVGKPVTLLLGSGQELTGTVVRVGDHAVHLTRLGGGRDFFDAVVLLDRVSGVVFKVRGK